MNKKILKNQQNDNKIIFNGLFQNNILNTFDKRQRLNKYNKNKITKKCILKKFLILKEFFKKIKF